MSKNSRNRIILIIVALAYIVVAGIVLHEVKLTEYKGTLEENLSYEVPSGYELTYDGNVNDREYTRETDDTIEIISIGYYGLDSSDVNGEDEIINLDSSTECRISRWNWEHSSSNMLDFVIIHDGERYSIQYQCQETDRNNYFSSCSKAQEEELLSFVKSFDYHRPANEDIGNVFVRLYRNMGVGGLIVLCLTLLIFVGFPLGAVIGSFFVSGKEETEQETSISSRELHESMNREREARGETSMPQINTVTGVSSNSLARRDHSWGSVPDFFIKMFRRK